MLKMKAQANKVQRPNSDIIAHLAKELWATFEYGLPVSPSAMSNYIVKQIEIAGYEIVKIKND